MKFSTVIFDMDGLMFDTERIAQHAWMRAVADFGYTYPPHTYQRIIGRALPDVEHLLMQAFGANFPFQAVYLSKQHYFQDDLEREGIPLKPGLIPLLDYLESRSILAAVASSSPRATVLRNLKLAELGINRFATLVGGDEVLHGKPAPDIFLEVAHRLGVPPHDCLVLEDSNAGIKAAHAADMLTIMIPDLKPPTDETSTLAYRILDSLAEVQAILEEQD